jgi:hypothetical protein
MKKQQEWREEFENEFATLLRKDFKIYARPIDNPCNAEGDLGNIGEELMEFISQLLSERTFSKEELTLMQKAVEDGEGWAEEWMVGDVQMRALEKIDNLLKEEE